MLESTGTEQIQGPGCLKPKKNKNSGCKMLQIIVGLYNLLNFSAQLLFLTPLCLGAEAYCLYWSNPNAHLKRFTIGAHHKTHHHL